MLASTVPAYRLAERGDVSLACDEQGVSLGPIVLVERVSAGSRRIYRTRPAEEIARTLALAYGAFEPDDLTRRFAGLEVAAQALEAGDLAKAAIAAVQLRLPDLSPDAVAKLAGEPTLKKSGPNPSRAAHGPPRSAEADPAAEQGKTEKGERPRAWDPLREASPHRKL